MDLNSLKDPITNLIVSGIIGTISIIIVLIHKRVTNWFLNVIWKTLVRKFTHGKIKKYEIEKATKIREILIELRTKTKADRTSVFLFHNGSYFNTKNPIWKTSCTHESVKPGISSEIGNLQDIKASSIIESLQAFWGENYVAGIENISPTYCYDCPEKSKPHNKKVIFIDVNQLEDSYSKYLLIQQGIKYVMDVPIYNGESNCIGFITANYCSECDVEFIKGYSRDICKSASHIQFVLLNH